MENYHQASLYLETVARRALGGVERFVLGGTINSDYIDAGGAFTVIVAALSPYYQTHRSQVDQFIEKHLHLEGKHAREAGSEIQAAAKELSSLLETFGV
ncbi:hypothetical protein [Brevibacillus migulae]|uniref:hypothetical protein n=1 Tax=Brevibacillus migulae TaxID=1644114 RepID=UPI00106E8571|nr:hypothetical protein [Brevibacillus migulae]